MVVIIRRISNHLKIEYVKGVGALLYDAPTFYLIKAETRFKEEKTVMLLCDYSKGIAKESRKLFSKSRKLIC